MNEKVLGHFLRYKREHADLSTYTIIQKRKRRTPGLSFDEVASMAHVSVDWYTRIEQGRNKAIPSADVLADVCSVLRCSHAEVEYAFNLVNLMPPREKRQAVSDTLLALIAAHNPAPAFVMNRDLTLLATNESFQRLYGIWDRQLPLTRNWVWRTFNSDYFRNSLSGWEHYSQYVTAVFRKSYSEDFDSKFLLNLLESVKADPTFLTTWNALSVSDFKTQYLLLDNPNVGELYLIENVLKVPGTDLYVAFEDAGDQSTHHKLQAIMDK